MGQGKRVHVELVRDSDNPEVVAVFKQLEAGTGIGNIHRALANSPTVFARYRSFVQALRQETVLDPAERELAILCVLEKHHGDYELAAHRQAALGLGLSERQVASVCHPDSASGLYTERQRAVLRFAERMAGDPANPNAREEDDIEAYLDNRQRVELALTLALYIGLAHLTGVLEIPAESAEMLQSLRTGRSLMRAKPDPMN